MATISTDTPVKPLRQRMQHDMMMRGLLPRTQDQYIRHVRRFGRPPDTATAEDLRNFQIHQHQTADGRPRNKGPPLRREPHVTFLRMDCISDAPKIGDRQSQGSFK